MNPFSNTNNEANTTMPTEHISKYGSGAEQDRYGAHFGIGSDGWDRLKKAAMTKGSGAEQDRYQAHFGLDEDRVKAAAQSLINAKGVGAEQDRHAAHFGLGADGWARAKELARMQGVGAEQDRYGSHFSFNREQIQNAAESIQEGAKEAADSLRK